MHCRQIDSLKERYEACRLFEWVMQNMTLPTGISLCLPFSQTISVSFMLLTVPCCRCFICLSEPPGGWQGETGNRFRRGGAEKKPPMGSSGLWPCAALSGLVCMWECWTVTPSLTACRGANRSNRGTLSTCQAVPSQHTAALSLYSFTGVSISVCGNCAALHVCLCMHRYRWQIIILLAFSRTYTKEICSDFWFSAHFLFY